MKIVKIILSMWAAVFLASCGSEQPENKSELKGQENGQKVLCSVDGLPKDWIIVGHSNTAQCQSRRDWNAYVVKKATEKTEIVCTDSNIPTGYVKTRLTSTGNCGVSFRENAFVIEKL